MTAHAENLLDLQGGGGSPGLELHDDVAEEGALAWSRWTVPGPVSADFVRDESFIRAIMGPYGAAKTTTCYFDAIVKAVKQPRCKDGVRRHGVLTVRDTYTNLYKTAVASWLQWFPKSWGEWTGSDNRPATHVVRFEDQWGPIEIRAQFEALGEREPEKALDGYEFTQAFLNGASGVDQDVLTYLTGRVGRWPRHDLITPGYSAWAGVTMDFNAPDTDHWLYQLFGGAELRPGMRFFRQPGGLDPGAENLQNLRPGYYEAMAATNPKWWTHRFVHNRWGFSRAGEPVYPEYDDEAHSPAGGVMVDPAAPLYLGLDGGKTLHPAAVIGQDCLRSGRMRILAELAPGRMGASRFADLLHQLLSADFGRCVIGGIWADPTADQGADTEGGEMSWLETVQARLGVPIQFAPTNELGLRLEAVRQPLTTRSDGVTPDLVIDRKCSVLRKGFMSHYRYQKQRRGAVEVTSDRPEKLHPWSDVHDALQYLILGRYGHQVVLRGGRARANRPLPKLGYPDDEPVATGFSAGFDPMRY